MSRELDRRQLTPRRTVANREMELRSVAAAVSDRLPGAHRIRIARLDPTTGNPAAVASEAAPAEAGNYVQRAVDHVRGISRALGLTAAQPAEFVADPNCQTASSGAVAVHLQQGYKGIPIFQAAQTVRFEPQGAIQETVGSTVTVADEVSVAPTLSVQEAVLKAARHVATPHEDERGAKDSFGESMNLPTVNVDGFTPHVIAMFAEKPERPTVLDAGPFGDRIKASLLWFPLGDTLRLTWEVILTMPGFAGQYRTLVDAQNGEIQYCRQLVHTVAARGNVYRVHGGQGRQMTDFPRPLADYGLPVSPTDLPTGFPDTWVGVDLTVGNSVLAHLGASGLPSRGVPQNGLILFDPANATGDDQKVVNIFYYNCVMHDFFYLLGFREADGNFQQNNLGRGGIASDHVDARAHPGPVFGTANMSTPIDGLRPLMNMGLVSSTNRHTAFDSSVVFHEFTHGVTNRLVGGPANDRALDAPQSSGMGEGWSDYIACSINNTVVVGDWVVNDPAGIRDFPYDSNFPDHFGKLGTGRYSEEHNIGEIWCATLMEMNRRIGKVLGLRLVVDALKLTPANPSFLDARDGILAALDAMRLSGKMTQSEFDIARTGVWGAFAKFGMGPAASSNGAELSGIVADFNVPAPTPTPSPSGTKVEATPNLKIPDNQSAGVTHVLSVPNVGRLKRLAVSVDIQHTWIGDLRVTLSAPSGKSVVLHDRNGGNQHDLIATYRSENVPGLAAMLGDPAQGNWTLHIADLAGADVGTLRRWGLEFELETSTQVIQKDAAPAVTIPDNNPTGVSSTIAITQAGTLKGIKVGVDITHTWIGDLRVELVTPSGQQVLLHDQSGRDEDNLIRTYDSVTSPGLAALAGQGVQGNWVLRVKDLAAQDIGKLNKWSLELTI